MLKAKQCALILISFLLPCVGGLFSGFWASVLKAMLAYSTAGRIPNRAVDKELRSLFTLDKCFFKFQMTGGPFSESGQ